MIYRALALYEEALRQEDKDKALRLISQADILASKLIPPNHKSGDTLC